MKVIKHFISGIFIGIANIIPGVSGGTIAVVMDVFDDLIYAINNLFKSFKKSVRLLLPILLGMAVGIMALSSLLEIALEEYSFPTTMLCVGLIVGSVPLIFQKANAKKFNARYLIPFFSALAVVVIMSLFPSAQTDIRSVDIDIFMMLQLFFAGAIAAAAMVIPGISGSFVMILLGLYRTVVGLINQFKEVLLSPSVNGFIHVLKGLIPLGIGIVVGIVLISKLIDFLLKRFYGYTYYAILGLVMGSIFGILYSQETYTSGMEVPCLILAVFTFALGIGLSLLLGREKTPHSKQEQEPGDTDGMLEPSAND